MKIELDNRLVKYGMIIHFSCERELKVFRNQFRGLLQRGNLRGDLLEREFRHLLTFCDDLLSLDEQNHRRNRIATELIESIVKPRPPSEPEVK